MTDLHSGLPEPPKAPIGMVSAIDLNVAQGPTPRTDAMPDSSTTKSGEERKAAMEITSENNPAMEAISVAEARMRAERGNRLSLNAPQRRLEVPPIPGYHLHWFLESNVHLAHQAWYEFVTPNELPVADRSIGGRTAGATSEDLGGSRISQIGGQGRDGRPEALVLMKIRQEWYFDEQRKIAERNLSIIKQIFHKKAPLRAPEEREGDYAQRYTREAVMDMSNGRFRKVD